MKTKQLSSKQLIALVLILIGAVSSIFGITGLTKSSSEDPYESRNGIVMVYATVYDNEGNSEAGMGTGWAIGTPGQPIQYIVTNGHVAVSYTHLAQSVPAIHRAHAEYRFRAGCHGTGSAKEARSEVQSLPR